MKESTSNAKHSKDLDEKVFLLVKKASIFGSHLLENGSSLQKKLVGYNVQCFFDLIVKREDCDLYVNSFEHLLKMYPNVKASRVWLDNLISEKVKIENFIAPLGQTFNSYESFFKGFNYSHSNGKKEKKVNIESSVVYVEPLLGRALFNGKVALAQKLLDNGLTWIYDNSGKKQFPTSLLFLSKNYKDLDEPLLLKSLSLYLSEIFSVKDFEMSGMEAQKKNTSLKKSIDIVNEKMFVEQSDSGVGVALKSMGFSNGITLEEVFATSAYKKVFEHYKSEYDSKLEGLYLKEKVFPREESYVKKKKSSKFL